MLTSGTSDKMSLYSSFLFSKFLIISPVPVVDPIKSRVGEFKKSFKGDEEKQTHIRFLDVHVFNPKSKWGCQFYKKTDKNVFSTYVFRFTFLPTLIKSIGDPSRVLLEIPARFRATEEIGIPYFMSSRT